MYNNDLAEKTTYGTIAYSELNFLLESTTYNYAVEHNATYCIIINSASASPHDVSVTIEGIALGSEYLTYQYQKLNVQVPLRRGTQITLTGAIGDGVNITYLQGVDD